MNIYISLRCHGKVHLRCFLLLRLQQFFKILPSTPKHIIFKQQMQFVSTRIPVKLMLPWSRGSVLEHRPLPPVFESRCGHIWRLFHLRLRFIIFGGRSAHLAHRVHKSGRKTSIIFTILASVHKQNSSRLSCVVSAYSSFITIAAMFLFQCETMNWPEISTSL